MPERWEDDLRKAVNAWVLGSVMVKGGAYAEFKRHVEAAYQRGLMAGRSQQGYAANRRKRKEPPCAPSAGTPSPASSTERGEP